MGSMLDGLGNMGVRGDFKGVKWTDCNVLGPLIQRDEVKVHGGMRESGGGWERMIDILVHLYIHVTYSYT